MSESLVGRAVASMRQKAGRVIAVCAPGGVNGGTIRMESVASLIVRVIAFGEQGAFGEPEQVNVFAAGATCDRWAGSTTISPVMLAPGSGCRASVAAAGGAGIAGATGVGGATGAAGAGAALVSSGGTPEGLPASSLFVHAAPAVTTTETRAKRSPRLVGVLLGSIGRKLPHSVIMTCNVRPPHGRAGAARDHRPGIADLVLAMRSPPRLESGGPVQSSPSDRRPRAASDPRRNYSIASQSDAGEAAVHHPRDPEGTASDS
jgi:hypothetical protein